MGLKTIGEALLAWGLGHGSLFLGFSVLLLYFIMKNQERTVPRPGFANIRRRLMEAQHVFSTLLSLESPKDSFHMLTPEVIEVFLRKRHAGLGLLSVANLSNSNLQPTHGPKASPKRERRKRPMA